MPVFSEDTLARVLFVLLVAIVATIIAGLRLLAAKRGNSREAELRRRADLFRWLAIITVVWFLVTLFAMTRPA